MIKYLSEINSWLSSGYKSLAEGWKITLNTTEKNVNCHGCMLRVKKEREEE